MSETITKPTYHQTIDFESLMREARKHITALAGEVWTDHNSADPGITQLEVLAFCIADLSYRTSFDVKDIMTGYKGGLNTIHDLPLADIALPNNPVTIKDLRKVLIDLSHPEYLKHENEKNVNLKEPFKSYPTKLLVRNAFPVIAEHTEVDFFAVSKNGKDSFLTFDTSYEYEEKYSVIDKLEPYEPAAPVEAIAPRNVKSVLAKESAEKAPQELVKKAADEIERQHALAAKVRSKTAGVAKEAGNIGAIGSVIKYPPSPGESTTIIKDYKNIDQIVLNGLYSLQIEFEEDDYPEDLFLKDLNQNYFEETITMNSKEYTLSVLMPYWDDIKWTLKDADFAGGTLKYDSRGAYDYFIAVDKLNYDDYFYDYYAELIFGIHKLPLYIKVKEAIQDEIIVDGKAYKFSANFIDWNEISNGVNRNYQGNYTTLNPPLDPDLKHELDQINLPSGFKFEINNVGLADEPNTFDIQAKFKFIKIKHLRDDNNQPYIKKTPKEISLLTRITFQEHTILQDEDAIKLALENKYKSLFEQKIELENEVFDLLLRGNNKIYANYKTKINRVYEYLYKGENSIWSYLGQFRNLGEDYSKLTASRIQEIALFGQLIVAPNYNVNALLADVYFRIDQFLSPLVKFNSLSEMTAKGYKFEDLFNGPLLKHGFIEDADLDNLKRRSVVYTSDLIRIIMDVPGVLAVEDFNISSYIDNRLMGRNVINCLNLTNSDIYKPRFSAEKTGLTVWVDDKKQELVTAELITGYEQKIEDAKKVQINLNDKLDLTIPQGRDMEVESYYSIQNDFPEIYGIGPYGLPVEADLERRGQAKQLKAFLLPFEQLLANYLKQVAHLPALFSYHRDIKSTYATQPLYDVPDIQPLLSGFKESGDTWDVFKGTLDNVYQKKIAEGESDEEFLSRRNRFLSQLLSRFGESFEAYATQMFDQHKTLLNSPNTISAFITERKNTLEKLIDDKIAFAEDYHKVSAQRYKAFNMTQINPDRQSGIWNNANIAAYKLRLCRLLGIEKVNNESIFLADTNKHGELIDVEGMHIVEHILLRPRTNTARLMLLQNQAQKDAQGSYIFDADKDPYSFRITIVMSRYAGRFQQESFRAFTEKLIRLETPAHIRIDFNWTGGECGKKFEKDYSFWKQNVYKMKPFIFQKIGKFSEIDLKEITIDPIKVEQIGRIDRLEKPIESKLSQLNKTSRAKKSISINDYQEIKSAANADDLPAQFIGHYRLNVLNLQDELIQAMETPCVLKLQLYNAADQIFTPTTQGIITFEDKTTDVHNMRVSEIGGVITVFAWEATSAAWIEKQSFKPIEKTYFNISDFLGFTDGLTSNEGGRGRYRVEYALADREPVYQIIEVTKAIIPVSIKIIENSADGLGVMLNFNTETDGLFRISNQNWGSHFLLFDPENRPDEMDLMGMGYISSVDNNLPPTLIAGADGMPTYQVKLQDIYAKYGLGKYHITYELDGQSSFADIELYLELSIRVFDKKIQLLPNIDGIIKIPADLRRIDLLLELPGGNLSVYDLDAVSIPAPTLIDPSIIFVDDPEPFGTVAWYKKVNGLLINRDTDPVYQDGHHYRFVYEFGGETVSVIIFFEAPIIQLEKPTIKLFEKGKLMVPPYVLIADGTRDREYTIEFHPKDAEMRGWVMDNGTEQIIESRTVPTDYFKEKIEVDSLHQEHGSQPIFVEVKNAAGIAGLNFKIDYKGKEPNPTTVKIVNLANEKWIEPIKNIFTLVYDYRNKEQAFEFLFNNGEGELLLIDEDGDKIIIPVNGNRIKLNGVEPLPKGIETGNYEAIYSPKEGGSITFSLNVINLNPTFVLKEIGYKRPNYFATAVPIDADARTYIWRMNGDYVTRAKTPTLEINFGKVETITVELTMHLQDFEATFEMDLTLELLKKMRK
jgi:hypothetical protein